MSMVSGSGASIGTRPAARLNPSCRGWRDGNCRAVRRRRPTRWMRRIRIAATPRPISIRADCCVNTPTILSVVAPTETFQAPSQSVIADWANRTQDAQSQLRAGHEFGRRGPCLGRQHAVEDASGVAPVFGPVRSIDLIVDGVVSVHERDVFLDAARPDPTFVPVLRPTKPRRRRALDRSDVEAIAIPGHPDGHRLSTRAVGPD